MTQEQRVLQYIEDNGSISPMEAFPLGITKLATVISRMRRREVDRYEFDITTEYGSNSYGKYHYARYSNPRKVDG